MQTKNGSSNNTNGSGIASPDQIIIAFKKAVIDKIQITVANKPYNYREYIAAPKYFRTNDEANAIDQQFARYTLEWLGFQPIDWTYNQPQSDGKKANRPDYVVRGAIGAAFIVEDKNSTLDFTEDHLAQMRRYSVGMAGYAVWCNMRRLLAIRFLPNNTLKYETLVDISIETLFGSDQPLSEINKAQTDNLALFHLLFSKERFTQFNQLVANIGVNEETFQNRAIPLDTTRAIQEFIDGSRLSLNHLRLAALAQIQEAIVRRERLVQEEETLQLEWQKAQEEFIMRIGYEVIAEPVRAAIDKLTPRLGELQLQEIASIGDIVKEVSSSTGTVRFSSTLRPLFENWMERARHINSALLSLRFEATEPFRTAEAFQVWSERQSDREDVKPEIFAEQVAYVFFVRLLLVRVLEDKRILHPRLASDGGFLDWNNYIARHFQELQGISILNENYTDLLSRKASHYYLHFFQQAVFDWFKPDDFLLVETLEFLCRYNFRNIASDIIGFTYEQYIDRHARDRKGHFLTRPEVVEYMLDRLDYNGPQIIGRRILDPASGSGSFLVHAARRYRQALITHFCNIHRVPDSEESLQIDPQLRKNFARRYLDDLTTLFFGMELNPFACYLAEMNLLIQALDDLSVLQQAGDMQPIQRFRVYNTNSLDVPREVLDSVGLSGETSRISVPDRLSDRLTDEAYAVKAKIDEHKAGFFYIISNPPYVNSRQEALNTDWFRNAEFYKSALSGDTNLYLLFLRLGLYYLADYGQMVYIIPLTIFGDKSASAARKLFTTAPFSPSAAIRFYRGDILFEGVDQAVGIVRVERSQFSASILISGGDTIQEARANEFQVKAPSVLDATPQNGVWQNNWLVSSDPSSFAIWHAARQVSENLSYRLGTLLEAVFDIKQGDVNATILNPLRLGVGNGNFAKGHVAIYKGEDVKPYAPLPPSPSDWVTPVSRSDHSPSVIRIAHNLERLRQITEKETGIILRQVARLNTREYLIASWFERSADRPLAFTNELWRMLCKEHASEQKAKALLALLNSRVVTYLINLFSTNNHVSKDELDRVPVPDPKTFPIATLASLADQLLSERARLERDFVLQYHARLPEFDDGTIFIPPSIVLTKTSLPMVKLADLVGRGEIKNDDSGRIKTLRRRNLIQSTVDSQKSYAAAFAQVLDLFLSEPGRDNEIWEQAQGWQLPEPVAATAWLGIYNSICQQAQASFDAYISRKRQVNECVADWYGFDSSKRQAIYEGLPWARRRREEFH